MSKMDICSCMITLKGDKRTVVYRGPTNPLTYPEVNLMMFMHGERFVTEIKVIKEVETTNTEELQNLRSKYGEVVTEAFPGGRPSLPLTAPHDIPREIIPEPEPELADAMADGDDEDPVRRRKPANKVA